MPELDVLLLEELLLLDEDELLEDDELLDEELELLDEELLVEDELVLDEELLLEELGFSVLSVAPEQATKPEPAIKIVVNNNRVARAMVASHQSVSDLG